MPARKGKTKVVFRVAAPQRRALPAPSIKSIVKRTLNECKETKYLLTSNVPATVPAAGVFHKLSNIAQGVTDSQRIGDAICINKLHLKYTVWAGDATNLIRVIVFQWKDNDSTAPTLPDILTQAGGTPGYEYYGSYVHDNLGNKFNVLYDKLIGMNLASGAPKSVNKNMNMKYFKKEIEFVAGGGNGFNHIYMLAISDSAASTHPSLQFSSYLTYTDI